MRCICRNLAVVFAAVLSVVVVLSPGGYLGQVGAQTAGFVETFDGTPATPADYTNPHNWDFMVFGVNVNEPNLGQHGPNCEAPGFPYTSTNTHRVSTASNAVFLCNNHLMTSPGITGYGAVYMTPPALADFSNGPATISWDQSTLRTSSRDWVYITLTPFMEHHEMPYLNVDQHIPPHNIRVLLGGANTFLLTQQVNGQDVYLAQQDNYHTWDDVFHAQNPSVDESPTRRDTFQITLNQNSISFCMPQYKGFNGDPTFCWARNVALPQALSPSVWNNQATVQITHVVYNAEKACEDGALANGYNSQTVLDQYNIVHNGYGDANCPPNTWHWDNVSINPSVGYSVIQSQPADFGTHTGSPTTVTFAQSAPAGSFLSFVSWGDTPQLAVSFDNGASWTAPHFQLATAFAHPEVGENVFMPMPTGQRSIMVRGANGYWGTFEAQAFKIVSPPSGSASPASPPPPAATSTPVPQATNTPLPAATNTPLPAATSTPTSVPSNGACPCTIFANSSAPANTSSTDTNSVEVGVKFRADNAGSISGVRFYKMSNNTGTHTGSLWSTNGALLATATFTGESGSGWQQVNFNPPVAISANTTYVASYHTNGHYATDQNYFAANGADRGPLHALANGVDGGNGVYSYGSGTVFPSGTFNSTNYWVDVVYSVPTPTATPTPTVVAGTQTVTFDGAPAGRPLNGQYPSGLIDWGNNGWRVSGPWGKFTSNSLTFNGNGLTSASFTFVNARRLVSIDAYNGGQSATTLTISCAGQPTRSVSVAAGQLTTISTGWAGTCSTVTISNTNGWNTNFDNLKVQ